jgi:hypothetical protein
MEEKSPIFDRSVNFRVPILSGGKRVEVRVRFPTDEEWAELSRDQPMVERSSREGVRARIEGDAERDAELFELIRLDADGGPELDAAEASLAIAMLSRANVVESDIGPNKASVDLEVCGRIRTRHVLAMPTQAQFRRYNNDVTDRIIQKRRTVTVIRLEPAGQLYDELIEAVQGYGKRGKAGVPVIHKEEVVATALRGFREMLDDLDVVPETDSPAE